MGLLAQQGIPPRGVPLVMQPRNTSGAPAHNGTIDGATLYLCRQGRRWVVVIESPRVTGAVPLPHAGRDGHDARFELLERARQACPDAAIISTDGALTAEDYEWRIEVRGVVARAGDLGVALHGALRAEGPDDGVGARPMVGGRCHWGLSSSISGRPRVF